MQLHSLRLFVSNSLCFELGKNKSGQVSAVDDAQAGPVAAWRDLDVIAARPVFEVKLDGDESRDGDIDVVFLELKKLGEKLLALFAG